MGINMHIKDTYEVTMEELMSMLPNSKATKQVNKLMDEVARLNSEVATLQTLVPHPGDGSCEVCGCVPATTATLCEECRDKINAYRVDCCNENCGWSGMSCDCSCQPHTPDELLCPECHEVVEPVAE